MNAVVTLGALSYGTGTGIWDLAIDVHTDDPQYDCSGYAYNITIPANDATSIAAWVSDIKTAAIGLVSAAGGPTMSASDLTIFGGPIL